ncbi:unnamed protein product [Peronospora belbahrii]|uniref:Uncharacterized protein n=1 Tax=Peronospora belbahrii TaxID=622444 RepID=A0AAU9KRP2_9STRA|nr:unnamed protein product [Peronospora belbahrii]
MSALPIQGAEGVKMDHDDFQNLTSILWGALRRLADVAGVTTVVAILKKRLSGYSVYSIKTSSTATSPICVGESKLSHLPQRLTSSSSTFRATKARIEAPRA